MPEAVEEAAHACLQKGETMRKLAPIYPPFKRDLMNAFDKSIRNFWSDVKGYVVQEDRSIRIEHRGPVAQKKRALDRKKIQNPWFVHQSISHTSRHSCKYKYCPGRNRKNNVRKNIIYTMYMRCEEYSVIHNTNMYFCNTTHNFEERKCHERYH